MAGGRPVRLPPGCGARLTEPWLFNPYADAFMKARRLRFCLKCETVNSMDENCAFTCPKCGTTHTSNLTAPRVFDRFSVLAGRGGGKTEIGARAAREEMMAPGSIGWVLGPTYKILHDSTFPTLVGLIPPSFVKRWDPEHMEITLMNDAKVAFRSLEDPDRARGPHGVSWGWFDEAAQSPVRAYEVFEPTLIKAGGIVFCTTTVLGYDWTYDKIEKRAMHYKEPGYWSVKWWTEENPLFQANPVMKAQIDRARKSMSPEFYAQEYKAERHNAEGLVYDYKILERQYLATDDAIRAHIPEWPNIDPSRQLMVGLDSGADHPFGAALGVVTPTGVIIVRDYLKRMQAVSQQLPAISETFHLAPGHDVRWSANKNEANLRLEFGLKGIGVIPAENKHEIGIQRVQSWLYSGQLFFAYTALKTYEQMRAYRYAPNTAADGQKKAKEAVFKFADELPDAVRYMLMAWPHLPKTEAPLMTDAQAKRWNALDDKSKDDIQRVKEFGKREKEATLDYGSPGWPMGDFFGAGHAVGMWD